MRRTLSALVAVLVGVVVVASCGGGEKTTASQSSSSATSAATSGSNGDCKAGVKDLGNGVQARTFCGAAKASTQVGSTPLSFSGGECQVEADYVVVNIGTVVLGTGDAADAQRKNFRYFGVLVGKAPGATGDTPAGKDGTYSGGTVTYNDRGTGMNGVGMSITLSNNRQSGSFTGKTFDGSAFSGTWTC